MAKVVLEQLSYNKETDSRQYRIICLVDVFRYNINEIIDEKDLLDLKRIHATVVIIPEAHIICSTHNPQKQILSKIAYNIQVT